MPAQAAGWTGQREQPGFVARFAQSPRRPDYRQEPSRQSFSLLPELDLSSHPTRETSQLIDAFRHCEQSILEELMSLFLYEQSVVLLFPPKK